MATNWQFLKQFSNKTIELENGPKRCKEVHIVDLGESFSTHIFLENVPSIQPRTSLVKFARSLRTDPPGLLCFHCVFVPSCFEFLDLRQLSLESILVLSRGFYPKASARSGRNGQATEKRLYEQCVDCVQVSVQACSFPPPRAPKCIIHSDTHISLP